ncbi:MAG TPA: transglycosylase domain-containing protein, partial [Acidimicrobiales bacterium]|nr:transglycosylase domain-containing protein [Acidimicrobiales bacterium]
RAPPGVSGRPSGGRSTPMDKLGRFSVTVVAAGTALALAALALIPVARLAAGATHHAAVADPVQLKPLDVPSKVYDAKGNLLAVLQDADYRAPVSLAQVPQTVIHAVLDAEDATFYQHGAVSIPALLRALKNDVSGGDVQGGSTITQQLVKNAVLDSQRSVNRKLHEAILAFRLEQQMTKDQILERYLNTVYLGDGAYGIEAAAQTYFGTDVSRLNPAQAALLAGEIRNPEGNEPIHQPAAAAQRRNEVLDSMVSNGHLTASEADQLKMSPLPTTLHPPAPQQDTPFLTEVRAALLDPSNHQFDSIGTTQADRQNALYRGGLTITTTLDPTVQRDAERAVAADLPDTGGKFTAAVTAIDPTTGYVRALVPGNPGAAGNGFDVATGRGGGGRQPGSSFKAIVLMAALANGFSPNDTIDGTAPCTIALPGSAPYVANNAEVGAGVMNLVDATVNSVNCAYIRLGVDVGLPKIVDMAHLLGIPASEKLGATPALSIGSYEVTPLQMASVYATIAADGVHRQPTFVAKVTDSSGTPLYQATPGGTQVVPAQVARTTTQILQGVVQRGTGTAANLSGRPVAGKTGTTDNLANAWFVGYTPHLATAVWMGSPTAQVPMHGVGGVDVFGGTYPARIFHDFMGAALAGQPAVGFSAPDPGQIPPGHFLVAQDSPGSITTPPPPPAPPAPAAPPPAAPVPPAAPPPAPPAAPPPPAGHHHGHG